MAEMTEEIGKVKLDYSKYPGEDFYSEGAAEDALLEIVKNKTAEEYDSVIEEQRNWPVLYHLSFLRENIVDWLPIDRESKVLEVGSGCGAITGALARKAGSVSCVDLSKKRSLINAYRHREYENITIHVGNFKDIEPDLPGDFDFICLIGVFEYGQSYIGGNTPYEDFLKILLPHLAEGGRIVIAIENKYGLKYFAGCREDHLGTYFSGIENYGTDAGVRTFSRNGLERIFKNCGVENYQFYYPYPDYKFMTALYSDAYLPKKGELFNNLRNFDRDRMLLFNEKNAFDGLVEDGLFPAFSNSYVAVLGDGFDIKFVKYSNDRAPDYAIKTEIREEKSSGEKFANIVRKYPMSESAVEHVRGMAAAYESLKKRYEGGDLEISKCELVEGDRGLCAQFEFVQGIPLLEWMDRCLEREDLESFHSYFRQYVERVGYNSEYPAADFDLVFGNILVTEEGKWVLIDYEWTFGKQIETKRLAFRAAYWYLLEDEKRKKIELDWILKELAMTEKDVKDFWEQEGDFQRFVTGKRSSMAEMREKIGCRIVNPQDWIDRYHDSENVNRVQIYEDRGSGYSEENSYFVRDAYQGDWLIELDLQVGADVEMLRIDPGLYPCMVKIQEMTFNGETVPLHKRKMLYANGRIVKPSKQKGVRYCPSIVFPTEDPNINIALSRLQRKPENTLRARMEIVRLPLVMAQDMAGEDRRLRNDQRSRQQ